MANSKVSLRPDWIRLLVSVWVLRWFMIQQTKWGEKPWLAKLCLVTIVSTSYLNMTDRWSSLEGLFCCALQTYCLVFYIRLPVRRWCSWTPNLIHPLELTARPLSSKMGMCLVSVLLCWFCLLAGISVNPRNCLTGVLMIGLCCSARLGLFRNTLFFY